MLIFFKFEKNMEDIPKAFLSSGVVWLFNISINSSVPHTNGIKKKVLYNQKD